MGSGSVNVDTAHGGHKIAALSSIVVRAGSWSVAMLGIDDRSGRAAATHTDIELVFVAVVTHLGKASSKAKVLLSLAQGCKGPGRLVGLRAVQKLTAVGRDGTPQFSGWVGGPSRALIFDSR
jgi:hypothetical protein